MLPELIEIEPLNSGALERLRISVPGSKSITNRALVLAAMGAGVTDLEGALWSEDTQVMLESLGRLGFEVSCEVDARDEGNRLIRVHGRGGRVPKGGPSADAPLELWVGNAGTAARFLTAMVCLGDGWYRLSGVPRMHERPQAPLFRALRELGYEVQSANDRLPALVRGAGPRRASCRVGLSDSSQFASALLLSARAGGWSVEVARGAGGEAIDFDEAPYVTMTERLVETFPAGGGKFAVEPDASSGSYFWAAEHLLGGAGAAGRETVAGWPTSGWQIDAEFPKFLPLPRRISRASDLGDSIMTAIVLAPWAEHEVEFADLGRLRVQECERVKALRTELTRCGVKVEEEGDTLRVTPGPVHGAEIETYQDHRMAMCFAILGLKVGGMRLKNPACVRKTFPNFFQKLAAARPGGLGARIRDPRSGEWLSGPSLCAD